MTKWNITLTPGTEKQARAIKTLPEPFGYCDKIEEASIEHPTKKKELIENVHKY